MSDFWGFLISFAFVFAIIGIGEGLRLLFGLQTSFTRKFIHIGVGHWVIFAALLIESRAWASVAPIVFVGINYLSYKKGLFQAMQGERNDLGTVYYSLSLVLMVLFFWKESTTPFIITAVLVMAWGDALAAIFGKKWGQKKIPGLKHKKTWVGSCVMLLSSFIVSYAVLGITIFPWGEGLFVISLLTALLATALEIISPAGRDNLNVPLGVFLWLFFLWGGL